MDIELDDDLDNDDEESEDGIDEEIDSASIIIPDCVGNC